MFHNRVTLKTLASHKHFSNPIAIGKLSHHVKVCFIVRDFSPAIWDAGDGVSTILLKIKGFSSSLLPAFRIRLATYSSITTVLVY